MTSKEVLELIRAGYTKTEIDALLTDANTSTSNESKVSETENGKEKEKATETPIEVEKPASDTTSNAAILAAINTLNKSIQELNRNTTVSDGNTGTPVTESVNDVLSKMFK